MVELDVKIGAGDLYDYMLRHSYNSPAGLIGSTVGAIMVICALSARQWLLLIGGIILLLYLPWTLFIKSRQQALTNPVFKEPLHYVLDEKGMTISQGEESSCVVWENMVKAVSTSRSIILYTSRINATIFPKGQMEDKKEAVIEMISTHMPPAKVKIKM
ncbi:MAG: YcxB family protein [Lachnospiraceae bacterium]|nr:YcxB family protein [Lachnospiraceae bacterium]